MKAKLLLIVLVVISTLCFGTPRAMNVSRDGVVENLQIVIEEDGIQLTWDALANATSYIVYSSFEPYGLFEVDESGVFSGTSWSAPAVSAKSFYYVTAVTESGGVPIPPNFVFADSGSFRLIAAPWNWDYTAYVNSFYIDAFEVTQQSYEEVMGYNPSQYSGNPTHPVEQTTWFNAIEYCNRRSILDGLTPCYTYSTHGTDPDEWYAADPEWNLSNANHINFACNWSANGYRLPTAAEWTYAAKGAHLTGEMLDGSPGSYHFSGTTDLAQLPNYAWYNQNNTPAGTKSVGQKIPNQLGAFDMSGNVAEWVWDIEDGTENFTGTHDNPTGDQTGEYRIMLGGGYWQWWLDCLIWKSSYSGPGLQQSRLGFRVLRAHQ